MKTEAQIREEFIAYFTSLKAENENDGAKVNKAREWEFFVGAKIDNEEAPEEARQWKCPRFKA